MFYFALKKNIPYKINTQLRTILRTFTFQIFRINCVIIENIYLNIAMKKLLILFFFFISLNAFTQVTTSYSKIVDSTFTISDLESLDYAEFKEKVKHGEDQMRRYALKVTHVTTPSILQIPLVRIKEITVYQAGKVIPNYKPSLYNSYLIDAGSPVYVLINNTRHTFIPIKVTEERAFFSAHSKNMFVNGLYYGLVFIVILINLFYYFKLKERTFLYYSLFLFFLTFTFFIEDGLYFDHTPHKWFDFGGILNLGIAISCSLFATSFLNVEDYYPKVKYTTALLIGLIFTSYMSSKISGNHLFYTITKCITCLVIVKYWIIAFLLVRKNRYSIYFVLGYSVIFSLIILYYLFPAFGFYDTGVTVTTLKFGSLVEIILLNYAVVYRLSLLKEVNAQMKVSISNFMTEIDTLKKSKMEEKKQNEHIKSSLNEREIGILNLIKAQKTNEEMAQELYISVNTVKYHIKNIYRKLDIKTREEARIKTLELVV